MPGLPEAIAAALASAERPLAVEDCFAAVKAIWAAHKEDKTAAETRRPVGRPKIIRTGPTDKEIRWIEDSLDPVNENRRTLAAISAAYDREHPAASLAPEKIRAALMRLVELRKFRRVSGGAGRPVYYYRINAAKAPRWDAHNPHVVSFYFPAPGPDLFPDGSIVPLPSKSDSSPIPT